MRIRKNAKFSQLSTISTPSPSSNSLTKTHLICQLNQSPWDVFTFPDSSHSPLHFQVDEDFGFAVNGRFGDSIEATQSLRPTINACLETEEMLNDDHKKSDFSSDCSKEEKIIVKGGEEEEEDVILCCATDGKGWQCGRIVKKNGHKMCARHLISGKKSDGTGKCGRLISGKKSDGIGKCGRLISGKNIDGTRKRGRGRPRMIKKKEPAAQTDENLSEYYYYSGFGPLWGKKKGPGRMNEDNATCIFSKNEDKNTKKPVPEIDYMECDDDDDDEEDGGGDGKKRGRKRIKARSLKSLM